MQSTGQTSTHDLSLVPLQASVMMYGISIWFGEERFLTKYHGTAEIAPRNEVGRPFTLPPSFLANRLPSPRRTISLCALDVGIVLVQRERSPDHLHDRRADALCEEGRGFFRGRFRRARDL